MHQYIQLNTYIINVHTYLFYSKISTSFELRHSTWVTLSNFFYQFLHVLLQKQVHVLTFWSKALFSHPTITDSIHTHFLTDENYIKDESTKSTQTTDIKQKVRGVQCRSDLLWTHCTIVLCFVLSIGHHDIAVVNLALIIIKKMAVCRYHNIC